MTSALALMRLARPRQWAKNILVLGAPLAAGQLSNTSVLLSSFVAFAVLLLASIGTYILNDIRDVELDRRHPKKKNRPFVAGEVSTAIAIGSCLFCTSTALLISMICGNSELFTLVCLYLVIQLLYQAGLKNIPLVEIVIVSSGFVIRAIAGGVAASLSLTPWFISVVASGSLFVVSAKRHSEHVSVGVSSGTRPVLEHYTKSYLQVLWVVALTCSIIFYSMWAVGIGDSSAAKGVYSLLSAVPFSLMLLRYASYADRGLAESPESLLFKDRLIQATALSWVALYWIYST